MIANLSWASQRGWAIFAWATVFLVIAATISVPRKAGKLYPTFVHAGVNFHTGQPMYKDVREGLDQYRYSPWVAAIFAPWEFLPTPVGAILWRLCQVVLLLLALRMWCKTLIPPVAWPALFMLALPIAGGNVHNGQINPLILTLMLAAVVAFGRERYWLTALAIAAATLFKIYPVALGLLLVVLEPFRLLWRLAIALLLLAGSTFLMQDYDYVRQQYIDWYHILHGDDRIGQPAYAGYHDFQKLLAVWRFPISIDAYRILESAVGFSMAVFLIWGRIVGWTRSLSIQTAANLGFLWVSLFGPATESATYILLCATASQSVLAVAGRGLFERAIVRGSYGLMVSMPIALWLPPHLSEPWRSLSPQSHGALLLLGWVVFDAVREGVKSKEKSIPVIRESIVRDKRLVSCEW